MSATASGTGAPGPGRRRLPELGPAEIAFLALLAVGFISVLAETRGFSFNGDEWDYVVARQGMSAGILLRPHGPHLTVLPILIYKLLLALFGGGSYLPFRVVAALDLVIVALALGVACRDRWGRWWGLAPVLLFVTLGPGAVTTLWPFQVGYALAVAAGFAALIALDRRGRLGDVLACAALVISLASGSQGIGFVVAIAGMILLQGDWRRRAWVVLVPAILYLLWYAEYGRQASQTHLGLWGSALGYCFQALSATLGAAVGLSTVAPSTGPVDTTFGVPLALAAVAAVVIAVGRGWRPRPIFWGSVITLVVILVAASLSNYGAFVRPPTDPRYLSSDLAIVLLCLCIAVPRPRLTTGGAVLACIVLVIVGLTNQDQYGQQRAVYLSGDQIQRAELGALEITRGVASPTYSPGVVDPELVNIHASAFFRAVHAFGLNEASPTEIFTQPAATRVDADAVLQTAELSFSPVSSPGLAHGRRPTVLTGHPTTSGRCLVVGDAPLYIQVHPGSLTLTAPAHGALSAAVSRFAPSYASLGSVSDGRSAAAAFPADQGPQVPWRMMLSGTGGRVCPAAR